LGMYGWLSVDVSCYPALPVDADVKFVPLMIKRRSLEAVCLRGWVAHGEITLEAEVILHGGAERGCYARGVFLQGREPDAETSWDTWTVGDIAGSTRDVGTALWRPRRDET